MAVPKKKMSKSKKNSRKSVWKRKAYIQSLKAISLAKSVLITSVNYSQYFGFKSDSSRSALKEFVEE